MSVLSRFFNFLNKDLTGKTWEEEAEHDFFGSIVLVASKESTGSYWEAEVDCEGRRIFVGIESPHRMQPTGSQVEFARRIISDTDSAFDRASALLVKEFEQWHKLGFPEHWRDAFSLVGFTVPEDADDMLEWNLSFEDLTDKHRHHFTCNFKEGIPAYVTVDG
jgi:hypothetical protein